MAVADPPWHYDERMDRIHTGCGGEVWYLADGLICGKCGAQQDDDHEPDEPAGAAEHG